MRAAVISDIHANLHALEAVLADVEAEHPDVVWCLGDVVGYGPRPNECCAVVAERADLCLVGNHDLVTLGHADVSDFNFEAAAAALWTRAELTDESRRFLDELAPSAGTEQAQLFHASARDPVWEYILSEEAALATLSLTTAPLVLVGHSHVALALSVEDGGALSGGVSPAGTEHPLDGGRSLLNPGSVGQPRDGDPRAAWLLLDFERRFGSFRRVAYPIEETQAEMREAGLPETLATRLESGQ
jgi:diadenosine tetraphosphatase ApaH/serine/threonine PP2A family protein phosphatase